MPKFPFSMTSSFAAAAVVCLIVIGGLSGFGRHPVIAYVSMDINPSVEMGIDAGEHVRELKGLNSDGTQLIDHLDYKGKPLDEITDALIEKAAEKGYFSQGIQTEIVIASTVVKPEAVAVKGETTIADEVRSRVAEQLSSKHEAQAETVEVTAIATPKEVREQARSNGLSAGKYAIYLAASNNGHVIPLQAFKEDSIRDIAAKNGGLDNLIKSGKPATIDEWKKLVKDDKDGALGDRAKKLAESLDRDGGDDPDKGGKGNNDGKNGNNGNSATSVNGKSSSGNSGSDNGTHNGQNRNNVKGTTNSSVGNTGKGAAGENGNSGGKGNDNGKGNDGIGKNNGKNDDKNDGKLPPAKLPAVISPGGKQQPGNGPNNDKKPNDEKKQEDKKQDDGKDKGIDKTKPGDKQPPQSNGKQADDDRDKPRDNKKPDPAANKPDEANKQDGKKQDDKKQEDKKQDDNKKDDKKKDGKDVGGERVGRSDSGESTAVSNRNAFADAFSRFEELFKHHGG
jgi:hypothetical protein